MSNHGPDVVVRNEGSLVLLELASEHAREWVEENVQPDAMWWAGCLVCEPRYVADLVAGMEASGLRVS